jgi:hypothetical protein
MINKKTILIDLSSYQRYYRLNFAAWVDAGIDANIANIANITTANITQINARLAGIRQALKLAAGAILTMRDLFILAAKLLIYMRDLVIRFR